MQPAASHEAADLSVPAGFRSACCQAVSEALSIDLSELRQDCFSVSNPDMPRPRRSKSAHGIFTYGNRIRRFPRSGVADCKGFSPRLTGVELEVMSMNEQKEPQVHVTIVVCDDELDVAGSTSTFPSALPM